MTNKWLPIKSRDTYINEISTPLIILANNTRHGLVQWLYKWYTRGVNFGKQINRRSGAPVLVITLIKI